MNYDFWALHFLISLGWYFWVWSFSPSQGHLIFKSVFFTLLQKLPSAQPMLDPLLHCACLCSQFCLPASNIPYFLCLQNSSLQWREICFFMILFWLFFIIAWAAWLCLFSSWDALHTRNGSRQWAVRTGEEV